MENNEIKYRKWLEGKISKKRLAHVLSVVNEASYLAKINGADIEKCRIAALLHDAAKELTLEEMQFLCRKAPFPDLLEKDFQQGEILHGFAAAVLIQEELGIKDEEILEAVCYHTIGKKDLSLVAQIVYIADAIEATRSYPSVSTIRKTVYENLQKGILMELEHKATYLTSIGAHLHPSSLEWKKCLEGENI